MTVGVALPAAAKRWLRAQTPGLPGCAPRKTVRNRQGCVHEARGYTIPTAQPQVKCHARHEGDNCRIGTGPTIPSKHPRHYHDRIKQQRQTLRVRDIYVGLNRTIMMNERHPYTSMPDYTMTSIR